MHHAHEKTPSRGGLQASVRSRDQLVVPEPQAARPVILHLAHGVFPHARASLRPRALTAARKSIPGARDASLSAMPLYRLVFPSSPNDPIEDTPTAVIDSGEVVYEPGAVIEHEGKKWRVSQAPIDLPELGATVDLMVWPADERAP